MKKSKLLSALTALSLMVVPCASLTANARTIINHNNGGANASVEEFVKKTFGEDAFYKYYSSSYLYFVITPDDIGDFMFDGPYYTVKVKESSDVDLIGEVENHCSDYVEYLDIEKIDDTTYKFSFSDTYKYPNGLSVEEFQSIWNARLDERDKACSKTISFLSEHDDVASINRYYNFSYETVNSPEGSRIVCSWINVSGDFDFDYEKYSDYTIEEGKHGVSVSYDLKEGYFKRMYDAYASLTEDYGEENVEIGVLMQDSVGGDMIKKQPAGENLYTAAIKGDINNNGVIDIADVVAVSAYVNDPESNPLVEQSITNGDVHNTGDGLTSSDVLKIQQYIAGIITEL